MKIDIHNIEHKITKVTGTKKQNKWATSTRLTKKNQLKVDIVMPLHSTWAQLLSHNTINRATLDISLKENYKTVYISRVIRFLHYFILKHLQHHVWYSIMGGLTPVAILQNFLDGFWSKSTSWNQSYFSTFQKSVCVRAHAHVFGGLIESLLMSSENFY